MNNKIIYIKDDREIELSESNLPQGLSVDFKNGTGNLIKIHEGARFLESSVVISGSNNLVIFGKNTHIKKTLISMDYNKDNRCCWIEQETSIGGAFITMTQHKDFVKIGKACMLSYDITIRTQDGHTIYDTTTGKVLNKGGTVVLGDHVWVGTNVFISKNVEIANDVIIGACSVVTKSFDESFCSIAGVPAKKIGENVGWSIKSIEQYEAEVLNRR